MKIKIYFKKLFFNLNILKQNYFYSPPEILEMAINIGGGMLLFREHGT